MKGSVTTLLAQAARFVIQFSSTVTLARLLAPEDFGLVAMVTVVTGFGAIFMDLGLSAATIQAPDISHEQVTALFWINVAFGLALTATFSLSAPLLATIYGIPQLLPIAITLAFTFTIDSISAQHRALLRRAMQFKTLAIIEVTACLTGVLTGVGLAFYGAGHWGPRFDSSINCMYTVYCNLAQNRLDSRTSIIQCCWHPRNAALWRLFIWL